MCKAAEVNELAGPGKGVSVIKVESGDRVVDFQVAPSGNKEAGILFEPRIEGIGSAAAFPYGYGLDLCADDGAEHLPGIGGDLI